MSQKMVENWLAAYHFAPTVSTPMNIGNDDMRVQNELGLEKDKSTAIEQRHARHTLKT